MKLSELGALCKPGPFSISVPSDLYTIENLLCIVSHVGGMGGRNFSFFFKWTLLYLSPIFSSSTWATWCCTHMWCWWKCLNGLLFKSGWSSSTSLRLPLRKSERCVDQKCSFFRCMSLHKFVVQNEFAFHRNTQRLAYYYSFFLEDWLLFNVFLISLLFSITAFTL